MVNTLSVFSASKVQLHFLYTYKGASKPGQVKSLSCSDSSLAPHCPQKGAHSLPLPSRCFVFWLCQPAHPPPGAWNRFKYILCFALTSRLLLPSISSPIKFLLQFPAQKSPPIGGLFLSNPQTQWNNPLLYSSCSSCFPQLELLLLHLFHC